MSSNYKIGILGGIGPEATGEFYNKLIKRLQERGLVKSNRDYPHIIINSIPAPELIYDKISDEDLNPYIKGLKEKILKILDNKEIAKKISLNNKNKAKNYTWNNIAKKYMEVYNENPNN